VLSRYGDPGEEGFDDARQALVAVLVKQGKTDEARRFWKDGATHLVMTPATRMAKIASVVPPPKHPCRP
jgi:hypothetical protein